MAKRGSERWASVSGWSAFIALVIGLALAIGGYLSFASETQGNVLNNFSPGHAPANFARAFLGLTMVSRSRPVGVGAFVAPILSLSFAIRTSAS